MEISYYIYTMGRFTRTDNGNGNKAPQKAKRNPIGAPATYDPDIHPPMAFDLCNTFGFTMKELATELGVAYGTVCHWWWKHPAFKDGIVAGKDSFNNRVLEKTLMQRANGFYYDEVRVEETTVVGRRNDTVVELPAKKTTTTTKYILPHPGVLMFALVNRGIGRWKHLAQHLKVEGALQPGAPGAESYDWTELGTQLGVAKLETLKSIMGLATEGSITTHPNNRSIAGGK